MTQTRPEQTSGHHDEPDPRRWKALTVCLVGGFMTLLDVSIVNVALPAIRAGVHASEADIQWVLSGYALTFGLTLVPGGRLGDARGRRLMFLVSLAAFVATSALVGLSPSSGFLVVARLLQGGAGGLLTPQIAGLIQELFSGAERGKAFGALGATIGLSTAVGPILGGAILAILGESTGWRWIFFVNIPVGVVALILAFRLVPAGAGEGRGQPLDPVGVLLLGLAVVALLLPLVEWREWELVRKIVLLAVAVVLGAVFLLWERRYRRRGHPPVVNLELFREPSYRNGTLLIMVYFAGFTAIFFTYTLYLQTGNHTSPLLAGVSITPFAVGSGLAAFLGGRVVHRFGRALVVIGLLAVAVGLVGTNLLVAVHSGSGVGWYTAGPLLIAGIGSGLVISPNQTLTLAEVPRRDAGSAAGVLQTAQRVGSAVGLAAVGTVFFGRVSALHGDWAGAFRDSTWVVVGFVVVSLAVGLVDLWAGRSTRSAQV